MHSFLKDFFKHFTLRGIHLILLGNCRENPNISQEQLEKRSNKAKKSIQMQMKDKTFKIPNPNSFGILTCPHCGAQGKNMPNMKRFHFERCKVLQIDSASSSDILSS